MRRSLLGAAALFAITMGVALPAASDERLKSRFLRDAPEGWKHLEAVTQDISAKYVETTRSRHLGGAPQLQIRDFAVHLRVADKLLLEEISGSKGTTVRCLNPLELFNIHRDSHAVTWRFLECCSGAGDCCSPTFSDGKVGGFLGPVSAAYNTLGPFTLQICWNARMSA